MASFALEVEGFDAVTAALDKLGEGSQRLALMDAVGATVVSQTRRRLTVEKSGPDGKPWPEWSARYEKTRHSGHSLLVDFGRLRDATAHIPRSSEVEIGSPVFYAKDHQEGLGVPERPFLGLSPTNEHELEQVIQDWVSEVLK